MHPLDAIRFAGGRQVDLLIVFRAGGFRLSKQAISQWARKGAMPDVWAFRLRALVPHWFRRKQMAKVKTNPKPQRPSTGKLPGMRKKRLPKSKITPGPPFRPGGSGSSDTVL
jgi:hypothetical protein